MAVQREVSVLHASRGFSESRPYPGGWWSGGITPPMQLIVQPKCVREEDQEGSNPTGGVFLPATTRVGLGPPGIEDAQCKITVERIHQAPVIASIKTHACKQRTGAMAGGPNECRKRALECVRIANSSLDPKSRDIFADMARTWIQVAIDLEGIQTPWGPAPTRKEGSNPQTGAGCDIVSL
jgi:hypothetical protein